MTECLGLLGILKKILVMVGLGCPSFDLACLCRSNGCRCFWLPIPCLLIGFVLSGAAFSSELSPPCRGFYSSSAALLAQDLSRPSLSDRPAQEKLKQCIAGLRGALGISADLAYFECKGNVLSDENKRLNRQLLECEERVVGRPKVLRPIGQYQDGYLVDLGPHGSRPPEAYWKEGEWWKKGGCKPLKEMEHWTKDNIDTAQRHRWFRYGKCSSKGVSFGVFDEFDARDYCKRQLSD